MIALQNDPITPFMDEYESKDTETLKASLVGLLTITTETVARAAAIIGILESRGEDLTKLKMGLVGYLRRVACGQVLPEVVAKFIGSSVLKNVAALPVNDQKMLLETETVELASVSDGKIDTRSKPILLLEPFESRQLFASDHIRTVNEQASWLRSQQFRRPSFNSPVEPPPYTISGNTLIVRRAVRLTQRELERILKSME
jgi:hypothetical protein